MSKESFSESINIYSCLHADIARMDNTLKSNKNPNHISCENGISLFSSDGYGCLITRDFFKNIDVNTIDLCKEIFDVLTKENTLQVISNIITMSDISYNELKEKTRLEDDKLKEALSKLIDKQLIIETKSKHKSLEFTYDINDMYYISLCIILSTSNVLLQGIKKGISCHLGFGDFPIKLT